eukprot:UN28824
MQYLALDIPVLITATLTFTDQEQYRGLLDSFEAGQEKNGIFNSLIKLYDGFSSAKSVFLGLEGTYDHVNYFTTTEAPNDVVITINLGGDDTNNDDDIDDIDDVIDEELGDDGVVKIVGVDDDGNQIVTVTVDCNKNPEAE